MFNFEELNEVPDPVVDETAEFDQTDYHNQVADIEDGFRAASAIDQLADAHADTEMLSPSEGRALQVAVEAFCNIRILKDVKFKKIPSFEEFSTVSTHKRTSMETLQDVKAIALRIYDKLVELINKLIDYLRRFYNSRVRKNRHFEERNDQQEETIKQVLALPAPEQEKLKKAEFVDELMWTRLNIEGQMRTGFDFLRQVQGHIKQIRTFEYHFAQRDKYILSKIEVALSAIHKTGDAFQSNIETAISAIAQPHLTTMAHDQDALGELEDGAVLYNEKLRFGNCSFYQVGAKGQMKAKAGTFRGAILSEKESGKYTISAIKALDANEASELNSILEEHFKKNEIWLNEYLRVDTRLREISRQVTRKRNQKEYGERAVRRLNTLYEVLYLYMGLRSSADMALSKYDQAICTSLLDMIDKSIKTPRTKE